MKCENHMTITFDSYPVNEGFARVAVASFLTQLNPTIEEVSDVKTAISEAVTNAIIHAYENAVHTIQIDCEIIGNLFSVEVKDEGIGIADISQAMEPLYTTKPEADRAGMGFAFMEAFMDCVEVQSEPGTGTTVKMEKKIRKERETWTTQSL